MKKFLKVTCLVLLSMSLFMSCAKKDIIGEVEDNNEQDYSAAIEASLNDMVETSYDESSSSKAYTTLNVDWYGDQYLEATWSRSEYWVNYDVKKAARRIKEQTNLTSYDVDSHWDDWDSHFTNACLPGDNNDLLDEVVSLGGGSKCNLVLGITYDRSTDHQGCAKRPGYYCVADSDPDAPSWKIYDWPDPSLYMHELCHNLDAVHCKNNCVMNYWYAALGTTNLCSGCRDRINKYLK
ncbi:MAG: hypothetical protein K8R54_01620 [Bacteroidales bacterium]|nr:hypothetical protein [Bacteroidales bacterium]